MSLLFIGRHLTASLAPTHWMSVLLVNQQYLYYSLFIRAVEKGFGAVAGTCSAKYQLLSPVFRKLPGPIFICAKLSQTLHSCIELFI